ncbi:hypothetical protein OCGS_2612 [Oceaniovalibus guishaninsula JLT2003]|uniref:Uncharacterized protein n=1 Tax=Oceaniovalibus guishaninsula JLT2003 TaxID=1231392 RepID=K2I323_9RHOB|nr:hypothetical protein [Oceaniovalibus guishaninsula]EKE43275.1 hypothetical protein OCGS_2612 [Oceaniovalibus guishaninsula JLT2003]
MNRTPFLSFPATSVHAAFLAALLGLSPASAQQDQGSQQNQGSAASQGGSGQDQGGPAPQDGQDADPSNDTETTVRTPADGPSFVAVLDFTVELGADIDPVAAVTQMAQSEHLARLDTDPDLAIGTSGKLVFQDPADYATWLQEEADTFFGPVGGLEAVNLNALVFRPDLLSISDPEALLAGLENLSIRYVNMGNRSDGDADIDAVTVVCTGRGADCKPSN